MNSKAFEEFKGSYFSFDRDGPNTDLLLELEGDERLAAENDLLAAVSRRDSWAAVIGLGVLRSKRASEPLKELFYSLEEESKVDLALALWRIEEWPEAIDEFARVLRKRPGSVWGGNSDEDAFEWMVRLDVAVALREVRNLKSVKLLLEALDDPSDLVRSNAVTSLAVMYGPFPVVSSYAMAIMSDEPTKRNAAKKAIIQIIRPENPPPPLTDGYEIAFTFPIPCEYISYHEMGKTFVFHIKFNDSSVDVRVGDYLDGMLGKPVEFTVSEKERIVPRLQLFFEQQQMHARFLDSNHEPEPESWSSPEQISVAMTPAQKEVEVSLLGMSAFSFQTKYLPWLGAGIAGIAGASIGEFCFYLLETTKWSAWVGVFFLAVLGACLGQKFRREIEDD